MRGFIILLIFIGLGYFAYQAFINTEVIQSENTYEQQLRDEGIGLEEVPLTTSEAIQNANADITIDANSFFQPILEKIKEWQIQINTYIEAHL